MFVCPGSSAADLDSTCVRVFWSTLLPAVFVSLFCIAKIPLPKWFTKLIEPLTSQFTRFLTLEQAEALDAAAAAADEDGAKTSNLHKHVSPKLWKVLVLSWIALLELLTWTVIGAFNLVLNEGSAVYTVHPFITASVWLYATLRPVLRLRPTPPYDLFTLFFVLFGVEVLSFGGIIYDSRVSGISLPPAIIIVGHVTNFVALLALLATIFSMPVGIPGRGVDVQQIGKSISPEDYTTLWGWATFHWVWPLIKRGTHETLNEDDVWNLSPCFQSRPVFIQFTRTKRATLLRKLWAANSLDIILDFILSFVSVVFNYASPFFLKRILDAIAYPTPENRSQAFIFAFLAFGCTIIKAQADVQHLWIGRRAASRTRSELMAAIYDKALKRKDFSGIVDKDKAPTGTQTKEEAAKADDPKAGADVGKIVNLMAGDANRCSMMLSAIYMLYSAPFEIIIGSVFLYNLLGWSAFAGFFVLVLMWPLNSYITKRSIRIQKGVMAARDKRMGVLNELIGAVKFIKFFAWEDRWIARALDARAFEMKWMVKSRLNSVMFSMVWSCAPVLVSVISFLVFVMQGNELTVSIAFTAIALFNMIRTPLNIVPTFLVQVLQTGVALNRIAVYLDEDEVDEQVSSLKKKNAGPHASEDDFVKGFGIENGTFKWNEVEEKAADKKEDGKKPANGSESTTPTVVENDEADRSSVSIGEAGDHRFELKDITVLFPERQLSLITGPTASGKSALLMALLGELTTLSGRIIMSKDLSRVDEHGLTHSIAYSAQSSWLRHQSIKDNILFGSPYDEDRYNAVIECCALQPDLQVLEDGDATEIGARGVSLSGGQKARVALARAVYSSAKYVLLDDPLSAVDSHTARFLFEKLLQGPLLQHRTVVLVTHHVELVLPGAHYLVRMLDGRIDTQGTVAELRARGVLEEITQEEEVKVHEEEQVAAKEEPTAEEVAAEVTSEEAKPNVKDKKPRKLIKDEHRQEGGVKWSVYNTYLKASSYWTWGILATFIVIYQFLGIGEKLWIKYWGEAYGTDAPNATYFFTSFSALEQEVLMDGPMASHHLTKAIHGMSSYSTLDLPFSLPPAQERPLFYISVYAAIGLSSALVGILSSLTQYTGALRASRVLFKRLLESVVRATMRWHDTTPQGRMLNRFSKDIETVDSSLASSLQNVNTSLATFAASVITVSVIFPWFLVPAFFIGMGYRVLAIGYLNTGRDLRRMESNTRSPIFSGFGELLEGIVTVRAFSAEQRFLDGLHKKIDLTTKMWYSFWMTNRWLLLNFDFLGACSILVTTLFALSSVIGAGLAGLCITSAMAFTNSIYWCCRFWTALELDLNSVERVVEYLDLPQEPPAVIESCRPPAYWPSSESPNLIVVEDLVIKYAPELPPVLHNVSFSLKARERVGLLGRTGSGKSTLAMSILRFTDPASGRILIDGIDISTIGVQDLRSRLTFIPQEATLFSGTLRDNLDPFQEHEDSECLDVLYRVHLINESESQRESRQASRAASRAATRPSSPSQGQDSPSPTAASSAAPSVTDVESKAPITLDTKVSAGGVNFSQGQRQLIAMARALLRHSSIIVLDEATSSIDFATDAKIQTTIREEFVGSLLLTVAHRLKTVIDYDRLIVLDKGVVAEFDTPWNLIQKEDGIFRNMCLKSGMFAELEQAAKEQAAKVASS
ncbi:multidrug resistance-associated ABC transporter [Artomyces pyxidatus]|uniref:Multidrug resistance-associated ABC transporter n=1 Tax=Artomyces pyxidatus TaxID=48021 RepID=A0ACB8TCL6_9AGAM|nr:multidrug resistance-associated ABC transporter [Artomyces pyxidatus]